MTTAADDADEIAFEAFLAGRPVPAEADGSSPAVATFAGAVRATATRPGRPHAALAELLATGLLTDQSSPSTRTAPSAGRSPRRSRVRKRRFAMFFPALLAKFLAAGALAQAASGVGIAVVAFTGAGATGLLGNDVQTTLTSVVGVADATGDVRTPDVTAAATETETPAVKTPVVTTPAVETPAVETPSPAPAELSALAAQAAGPTPGEKFSAWMHRAFPTGKADGRIVSQWARTKHVDLSKVEGIEDVEGIDDSASATATPTAEVETEHSAEATHGNSGGTSRHGGGDSGRGDN
jgi:hypothetical protein